MKYKIFVDGQEGTTGLKINERLSLRPDLEILKIEQEKRKDREERRSLLNEADIAILCLPDEASRESVSLVQNNKTRIIDTSTAFRTDPAWIYGLPELNKNQRSMIKNANRVSVPGCHATGFILMLYPLIHEGIVPDDYPVTCSSVSGYSGGGKKMIAKYEVPDRKENQKIPRYYSLKLDHKHLPEMKKYPGLIHTPVYTPVVGDFYKGETVTIPLYTRLLKKKINPGELHDFFEDYYASERFVKILPYDLENLPDEGYFDATACNNTNRIEICILGQDERILILSRFDNLGKGSSGAALQNLNIMLGLDEGKGLEA